MTFISVLAVFGSNGTEDKSDKFQKLFYDGLVTALGSYASDVDAIVATSSPITDLNDTERYGTALIQKLSSGAPLRALFQPELQQFQAAFEETVAEAVETMGSGIAVVVIVYAGEILHSTGEWLLADSTFSGEQLQMWLDSEAASAWQPEIQKLTSAPTGTEPINIVVCTPSAGVKTRWPMAATPGGSFQLTMLSKSRRLPVRLQTTASWRVNGKLASSNTTATSYEALQALSGDLARLHWEHQSKLLTLAENQDFSLDQRSFENAPPALYLLPSGPGGVQSQACGILVIQGVNVLLGSAFADNKSPQWWPLVRSLVSLDTVILPDWSAASIQSYNFLTKHLLSTKSSTNDASWLGWLFAPSTIEPGSESPLLLTPPSSNPDPSRIHALATSDHKTRLFYKIGVGELTLHWLGVSVGALLIWQSAKKSTGSLTVFLPVTQPPEGGSVTANNSPAALLSGLVRMLRKVPEISKVETTGVNAHSTTATTAAAATFAAKKPGVTASVTSSKLPATKSAVMPAARAQLNGTIKHTVPATTKPTRPTTTNSTRPSTVKATTALRTSTVPPSRPSTASNKPLTTSASKSTTPRNVPSRTGTTAASKTSTSTHPAPATTRAASSRPTTATASKPSTTTKRLSAKTTSSSKKPTVSKTEAKLTEHAAKVAAKTAGTAAATAGVDTVAVAAAASKPGHEIKYAPAGRPSNLPPRRKVGEKTVMEELNELPEEIAKSLSTVDSLAAEAVKEEGAQNPEESEGKVSYPDSLKAEEESHEHAAKSPEIESSPRVADEHEEMKHMPTNETSHVPSNLLEKEAVGTSNLQEMEFSQGEHVKSTEELVSQPPHEENIAILEHHEELNKPTSPNEESLNSPAETSIGTPYDMHQEQLISETPAERNFASLPLHNAEAENLQEQHKESPEIEIEQMESSGNLKGAEMQFTIPPGNIEEFVPSKFPGAEISDEEIAHSANKMALSSPAGSSDQFGLSKSPEDMLQSKELSKSPVNNEFSVLPEGLGHHDGFEVSKSQLPKSPFGTDISHPQTHPDDIEQSKPTLEVHEVPSLDHSIETQFHEERSKSSALMDLNAHQQHQEDVYMPKSSFEQHDVAPMEPTQESQFCEEPTQSPADEDFPTHQEYQDDLHMAKSPLEQHEVSPLEQTQESQLHEELPKSPVDVDFTTQQGSQEDVRTAKSSVEQLDVAPMDRTKEPQSYEEISQSPVNKDFPIHQRYEDDLHIANSPLEQHEVAPLEQTRDSQFHEELSQSHVGMDLHLSSPFSHQEMPSSEYFNEEQSKSLGINYSPLHEHHNASHPITKSVDHNEGAEKEQMPEELLSTPAEVDFAMSPSHQDELLTSKSPEVRSQSSLEEKHQEDTHLSRSPDEQFHEKLSMSSPNKEHNEYLPKSPQQPLDESNSSWNQELSAIGVKEHEEPHETFGLSTSPLGDSHQTSDSPNPFLQSLSGCNISVPFEKMSNTSSAPFELSKSQATAQIMVSPDTEAHKDLGSVHSPAGGIDILGHHRIDSSATTGSYNSDIDSRPSFDYHIQHSGTGMQFGDSRASLPHQEPALTTTDDEYPVHEMNLGGEKAIPEVSDHVDSTEATTESMPPIHDELLYQYHSSTYNAQPADSTTIETAQSFDHVHSPRIGFSDMESLGKTHEENIHSPSSEVSNDSVIHMTGTGGDPLVVSSTSPSIHPQPEPHTEGSSTASPVSGFTSKHPFHYRDMRMEGLVHDITAMTDAALSQKFSPIGGDVHSFKPSSPNEKNGMPETNESSSENPADGATAEGSSAIFDPIMEWGQPQGMPAPVHPSKGPTALTRTSRPATAVSNRTTAPGTKTSTTGPSSAVSKGAENLPPGSPILLDVVWVPGYIIRVPFTMATQFFTQVRARVYILSGECLHPITGEALIAGVSKWSPEEREAVCKLSGGRGVEGITIVPTDEPLEWVRWLRRSAGGDGKAGTGEERLQAAGLTVHASVTLCDIHFSDKTSEITFPGTRLMI